MEKLNWEEFALFVFSYLQIPGRKLGCELGRSPVERFGRERPFQSRRSSVNYQFSSDEMCVTHSFLSWWLEIPNLPNL